MEDVSMIHAQTIDRPEFAWLACLVGGLLAIATTTAGAQQVSVDFDTHVDFSEYKTFAWKDSDQDLRDSDPLMHERVVRGIEQRLRQSGLSEVATDPDLYVTYYTAEQEETRVFTTGLGYSYYGGYGNFGTFTPPSTSQMVTFRVGTLVIDLWDAKTSKLVWRGTAEDTVSDNPQKNAKRIDKALDKLMKRWDKEYRKVRDKE
jgi:hypothetical protein